MYAVRLRASAELLMPVAAAWALQADKVLMYEHPEDGNIHCHFLLEGVYCTVETLKNAYKSLGIQLRGPGQVSFKTSYKAGPTTIDISEQTKGRYITYMTKGKYDPSYNKGYDPEYLEVCKAAWTTYGHVQTKDELYYGNFCNYLLDYCKSKHIDAESLRAPEVRSVAFSFAVSQAHGIVNVQTRKMASMCYTSYAFAFGLLNASQIFLPFEPLK